MYSNKKDAYFIRGYQVNPSSLAQASEMMLANKHDIPALLINLQWHSEVLHQSSQCSQASRGVSRGLEGSQSPSADNDCDDDSRSSTLFKRRWCRKAGMAQSQEQICALIWSGRVEVKSSDPYCGFIRKEWCGAKCKSYIIYQVNAAW